MWGQVGCCLGPRFGKFTLGEGREGRMENGLTKKKKGRMGNNVLAECVSVGFGECEVFCYIGDRREREGIFWQ